MKIKHILTIGFLSVSLLAMIIGFIGIRGVSKIDHSFEEVVNDALPVTTALAHLDHRVTKMRLETENYIISKNKSRLNELKGSLRMFRHYKDEIKEREAEQGEKWDNLILELEKFLKIYQNFVKQIEEGENIEIGKVIEFNKDEKKLSSLLTERIEHENEELEEQKENVLSNAKKSKDNLIVVSIIVIFLGSLWGLIISRSISKPLTKLQDAAKEIGKGKLNTKVKIKSKNELGELGEVINQMTNDLKRYQKKLLKSEKKRGKSLEIEVKKKTKELGAKVNELKKTKTAVLNMMEDLKETNEHLKDLDKAKSNFLNIVSHELKTPLTAMFAYLDIMDDLNNNLTKEELKAFDAIRRNSKQLKGLIDNILEISRIAAGKFELINTEINLKERINSAVENLTPLAENKGIKLLANLENSPEKIFSDEQRLEEIINNLVSNAIKFTTKGSVTIKAEKSGEFVKISVIDTGVGISQNKLKELGKKFYQVDASISRKYGGTGLGLSITKQLAELQGGRIEISSIEGKGSTFAVFLPIKAKGGKKDEKSTLC